jgi:hypothetical protein
VPDKELRKLLKTIRALMRPRGFVLAPYPDDVLDHGNVAVVVWRLPVRRLLVRMSGALRSQDRTKAPPGKECKRRGRWREGRV